MEKAIKDLDIYISDGNYSAKYPRSEEFVDKGIPFIRANNILDGDVIDDDMYYITPEKHKILQKGHVQTGDILITTRGNIGQVAIVPERHNDSNINAQIVLLRITTDNLYNRYLLWALQSNNVCGQYQALQTGTALKQLPVGKLEQVRIRLTEIDKQHTIANNLDKTYRIIKARQHELKLLDDLIKARFVEMFGDPVKNPKGWKITTIGDITTDVRYGTSKPAIENGKYPYLRMNNLTFDGHLDLSDLKYIDVDDDELEKCVVRKGDVLFNRTNSIELVGKTAAFDLDEEMIIAGYIIRVRLGDCMLPDILAQYMNLEALKEKLRKMAKGAVNQANINAQELQSIKIYLPDMNSQKQFVNFKKQTDKSKLAIQKSLEKSQLLFDSLMQEYFG
jgi:type I restriction enzyme S subunit